MLGKRIVVIKLVCGQTVDYHVYQLVVFSFKSVIIQLANVAHLDRTI